MNKPSAVSPAVRSVCLRGAEPVSPPLPYSPANCWLYANDTSNTINHLSESLAASTYSAGTSMTFFCMEPCGTVLRDITACLYCCFSLKLEKNHGSLWNKK